MMKTSKKILTASTVLLIVFLVTGLLIVRTELRSFLKAKTTISYRTLPVEKFDRLEFGTGYTVQIRQDRGMRVEVEDDFDQVPQFENETLHFGALLVPDPANHVRITVPSLKGIRISGNTQLRVMGFDSDSIQVVLEDSSRFIGENNLFLRSTFVTSGNPVLEFRDDPMQ